MSILVTGCNGQVGWELERTLQPLGKVIALSRTSLDLTNADQIRQLIREVQPSAIVNAAAYTAVDKAENEFDIAMAINGTAPGVIAEEARQLGALVIHYSTDYVFDGGKTDSYVETDQPNPLGSYGRSKLAGEEAIRAVGCRHLIFRTSWVYGLRGQNFLLTMLRLAREREKLNVVGDQVGAPTWSRMIAETTALALLRYSGQQGIYHLTAGGFTSWHGFAEAIFETAANYGMLTKQPTLHRIVTSEYPTTAARPANSRMSCVRLRDDFKLITPDWLIQLKLCLKQ